MAIYKIMTPGGLTLQNPLAKYTIYKDDMRFLKSDGFFNREELLLGAKHNVWLFKSPREAIRYLKTHIDPHAKKVSLGVYAGKDHL